MPNNMWMLLGLGAVAIWALNRNGNGETEGGFESLMGAAMGSTGVSTGLRAPVDNASPSSVIYISQGGDLFQGPPQGVPASAANDEDIGVLPLGGRYAGQNAAWFQGELGSVAASSLPSAPPPPLAQEIGVLTQPVNYSLIGDTALEPVIPGSPLPQTVTGWADWRETTIKVVASPRSEAFYTTPSTLDAYLAQFE
jgi:hypothetical protein